MKIYNILEKLEKIVNISLQEKWDNSGIQVLTENANVEKVIITLDITEETVDFAIENSSNLIVSHHPLIFSGIKSLDFRKETEKILIKAIKHNINILSFHTNSDKNVNGLADFFCKKLGWSGEKPLSSPVIQPVYKVVTFLPEEHLQYFLNFFENNNISVIGQYKACSFFNRGKGSFFPEKEAAPFTGEKEELNIVDEIRIEFRLKEKQVKKIIKKLKKIHPYEEPVFDIYLLKEGGEFSGGLGRIIELEDEIEFKCLINKIKSVFNVDILKYAADRRLSRKVSKIAVCPGSGMSLLKDVVAQKCDVFITGDVKYHEAQSALAANVFVIDLGHFHSEYIFTEMMKEYFQDFSKIDTLIFKQKDIFKYV
jgi:dinuclear metal center YbgI/SA1388 family protein